MILKTECAACGQKKECVTARVAEGARLLAFCRSCVCALVDAWARAWGPAVVAAQRANLARKREGMPYVPDIPTGDGA